MHRTTRCRGISELTPRATVTSMDGISARDLFSRRAVTHGLLDVEHTAVSHPVSHVLRRLRQVLPLSARSCRCVRPLDPCGQHPAACAQAGMLGRRGHAPESIMARICREGGGRVRTNLLVRDMDVPAPNTLDGRRLEVVVAGLPGRGGGQVAIDTTMVCALHRDGPPRRGASTKMAWHSRPHARGRTRTQSSLAHVDGRNSWFLLLKLADVGQRRPGRL